MQSLQNHLRKCGPVMVGYCFSVSQKFMNDVKLFFDKPKYGIAPKNDLYEFGKQFVGRMLFANMGEFMFEYPAAVFLIWFKVGPPKKAS